MALVTKLYLTALPNGVTPDGKSLQLTVLLSPQVADADSAGSSLSGSTDPFGDWPATLNDNAWNRNWQVTFKSSSGSAPPINPTVISADPRSELWRAVFDGFTSRAPTNRRDLKSYKDAWVLSHPAHVIQHSLQDERGRQSAIRLALLRADKSTGSRKAGMLSSVRLSQDQSREFRDQLNLYLYPQIGGDIESGQKFAKQMDAANAAMFFYTSGSIWGSAQPEVRVRRRIERGLDRLGRRESGMRLRAAALIALFQHCAQSLTNDKTSSGVILNNISREISDTAKYGSGFQLIVDAVQPYVEFHLFHRRSSKEHQTEMQARKEHQSEMQARVDSCDYDDLDFHGALARVNQFPAILRPLGLAVDLQVGVSSMAAWTSVSVSNRQSVGGVPVTSLTTRCTLVPNGASLFKDFYATSDAAPGGFADALPSPRSSHVQSLSFS